MTRAGAALLLALQAGAAGCGPAAPPAAGPPPAAVVPAAAAVPPAPVVPPVIARELATLCDAPRLARLPDGSPPEVQAQAVARFAEENVHAAEVKALLAGAPEQLGARLAEAARRAGITDCLLLRWRPGAAASAPAPAGPLDGRAVQQVIQARLAEVRLCYERALLDHPALRGTVTVRFTIAADGRVSSAEVASATTGNASLESCIVRAAARWTFPRPADGQPVTVEYPVVLATP